MLRRFLPVPLRFVPALVPSLYLQLRWTLPSTQRGHNLAASLTVWSVVGCAVLFVASLSLQRGSGR